MKLVLKHRSPKVERYDLYTQDNKKFVYVPDYTCYKTNEGLLCYKYKNGCLGIGLDQLRDKAILDQLKDIEAHVDQIITRDTENLCRLDKGIVTEYVQGGVTRYSVWASVIKDKASSKIYTDCYNSTGDDVNICEINSPVYVRVMMTFQVVYSLEKSTHRLNAILTEACTLSVPQRPRVFLSM